MQLIFLKTIFFCNYPECILIPEVMTTGTKPKHFQISKVQSTEPRLTAANFCPGGQSIHWLSLHQAVK